MNVVLAALDQRAITAIGAVIGLIVFGGLLVATAWGEIKGRRIAKVPPGMRPAPSDEELERRVLERYQVWGIVTTVFMALWLPALWFYMPTFLDQRRETIEHFDTFGHENAAERSGGKQLFDDFCIQCHGDLGEGLVQPYTREGESIQYAEPPLALAFARYRAAGRGDEDITRLLRDAIERGRPGTPMPTWSLAFGGPMNSYQVDNLIAYIKHLQVSAEEFAEKYGNPVPRLDGEAIYNANCAVCHGPDGSGRNEEGALTVGPNLQVALQRYTVDELRVTLEEGRINSGRPSMPSWAWLEEIRQGAIDALLNYIESIQRSS